jgi:phosphoenolpyruvate carboxykinase (diphosphate)
MGISWKDLGDAWLVDDPQMSLGWKSSHESAAADASRTQLADYLHMQLAVAGLAVPSPQSEVKHRTESLWSGGLLSSLREKNRLLSSHRPAVDERIESFLETHFGSSLQLPHPTLCLDRHGMGRILSLPADGNEFKNDLLSSYRVHNGVVHNPRADRRTTSGTFHVCEGGLPIPADKSSVPQAVFARLFQAAMQPPEDSLKLPYSAHVDGESKTFVSLLVRPLVCPAVPGFCRHKTMEVRFFVPGGLVSNLDFVESIFGNAGDPLLPENDAGLDVLHWSGHTGCVILAPHLCHLTKFELGLPHWDVATERQRRDSMCYRDPSEKYNGGSAFKLTCRTEAGVIVTLIADNYFGYCKKEVKTQISYAANLMGNVEEEHAGGALAFPSWSLGDEFQVNSQRYNGRTFDDVVRDYADVLEVHEDGYATDRNYANLVYIPENARASLYDQQIRWTRAGKDCSIALEPSKVYMAPSGYKLRMEKHPAAPSWRLIGTSADGIVCHKPCTVSGGGKSEISKSLRDYMLSGPIFVNDLDEDFAKLDELFARNYAMRWRSDSPEKPDYSTRSSRPLLDANRTLGSVIKLLTPSRDYTDEYNAWLKKIPGYIYAMAFIIKRFSKPEWDGNWRKYFSVDVVNGEPGHELKFDNRKLVGMYLRVGLDAEGRWQTYKLRQDFAAAQKIQLEDDITASVVVPGRFLDGQLPGDVSYKFVANCEYRLFQRPDDAVHRGLDKQTEKDISELSNFFCNFEPLHRDAALGLLADVMNFDNYTLPMQQMLNDAVQENAEFVVSSAHPRLVDGQPSKNPRYLQDRPDLSAPENSYIAERSVRFLRGLTANAPVYQPVSAILSGRRNNPPDTEAGIRSLAVYNPIHYQELPELFMDYVCSLTGKSPSTTGAGSEGALTKSPFNALLPIHDLNAALVSSILTQLGGFSTAAGFIGSSVEVGHDISYLVPELWCRLSPAEKDPQFLIREGMLEKLEDYEHAGQLVLASRLGYRITARFVRRFFGRMFDNPDKVFDARILCPETQDPAGHADGIAHIVEAQQRVAKQYFEDGSFELACPPLKAVLSVMAFGEWDGKSLADQEVRAMFERKAMLSSDWYRARLHAKREADIQLWKRHESYLKRYSSKATHQDVAERMNLSARITQAQQRLDFFKGDEYLNRIDGTLGTDPALVKFSVQRDEAPSESVLT